MNRVPFVNLNKEYTSIKKEINAAIGNVFSNSSFILGPSVSAFEKEFAQICGVKYCVGVNCGTSALHLALIALGIGPGDEMIIPTSETEILPEDEIFVLVSKVGLPYFLPMINRRAGEVDRVIIYKTSLTGLQLAKRLENSSINVTMIEPKKDKAEMAAAELKNTIILHGDATDIDLLKEASIKDTDFFIALSEDE